MNRTTKVRWAVRIALLSLCVYFLISSIYHFGEYKYWDGKLEGYIEGVEDGRNVGYSAGYLRGLEMGREWGYQEGIKDILYWESQSLINLTMGE